MTRNLVFLMLIFAIVLMPWTVTAAELSGTVYSQGSPVANLTIAVNGTETTTKTGPDGEYKLELAPGDYTLIIREREFPATVGPNGTSQDIQL